MKVNKLYKIFNQKWKQTGAELCQAQEKLGLAKFDLPSMKLNLSSIQKHWGDLPFVNKLILNSICQQIEVVFPLP